MKGYNDKNTEGINNKLKEVNSNIDERKSKIKSDVFADFDYEKIKQDNKEFNKKIMIITVVISVSIVIFTTFFIKGKNTFSLTGRHSSEQMQEDSSSGNNENSDRKASENADGDSSEKKTELAEKPEEKKVEENKPEENKPEENNNSNNTTTNTSTEGLRSYHLIQDVYLRRGPYMGDNIIRKVYAGDTIYDLGVENVPEVDDDGRERIWIKVKTSNGEEGYVSNRAIEGTDKKPYY